MRPTNWSGVYNFVFSATEMTSLAINLKKAYNDSNT